MTARFFMNLRYRDRLFRDEEGDELAGVSAARDHALATAQDMITHTRTDIIHDWFGCALEVTDESGRTVLILPFGDTMPKDSDVEN